MRSLGGSSSAVQASGIAIAASLMWAPTAANALVVQDVSASTPANDRTMTLSVPLVWNGRVLGDVIVFVAADESATIDSSTFETEIAPLLNEAGVARLRETVAMNTVVTPEQLSAAGFEVAFDISRIELYLVAIDGALRPVEPLGGFESEAEPLLPTAAPADFSAYLNTNMSLLYRDEGGLIPPDIFLNGAIRHRNVVVEYDGGFSDSIGGEYQFYRRGVRAVYDQRDSYRRWTAGDLRLENAGQFRTPFIAGVALEKSRRVFDPFRPAVNLGGREILLTSPSTVDVVVNGATIQSLDLQPGTYSLDDLPIRSGSNNIELLIRDASGREQITQFDYFFDPIPLNAGEEEYTLGFGLIAEEVDLEPSYSSDPVFVGNYRRALSDILIVGGGAQISEDLQVASFESQFVPQVVPGSFDVQGAVSTGNGTGFAIRGGYRVSLGGGFDAKRFSASFDYESDKFQTVGDFSDFRLETFSANATYSQQVSERSSVVAGANYFTVGGGQSQSTIFADYNYRIQPGIRATFGVEYGTGSFFGANYGVRLGISVQLGRRQRADATYRSRREFARASFSRGSTNEVGSLGYSVNLQNSLGNTSVDGFADYIANRFEARASLGSSGRGLGGIGDDQTARLQIGTSLAFADGTFGIGRVIQDSFLLARPHRSLFGTDVIVGQNLNNGGYEAKSGTFGAAVVGRLTSYNSQDILYDIDTLEAGYDIGAGVVRVEPPFRSGYSLVVGSDRFVSAVGFLSLGGEPAELASGLITSTDDEGFEPQPFFTNSSGRFGVLGLAPGRTYTVTLNNGGQSFAIEVPEDNTGLLRVGTIEIPTETR